MEIMYGWTEVMGALFWLRRGNPLTPFFVVIPTVAIPLTIIGVMISAVASFIAGLFGLELKWEGPKRLLEVFLKPRVIISVILLNLLIWGGIKAYDYISTMSRPLTYVQLKNRFNAIPSENRTYTDNIETPNVYENLDNLTLKKINSITQVWETKIPKGSFGGIVFSGQTLFFGSDDGYVYEMNPDDGKILRRLYVGTSATPKVVIWNEMLYAGEGHHPTHHGRVYAFDLKFGTLKGAFQTLGHTEGPPMIYTVVGQSLLLVMAGSDGIYGVDPLTLKKVWHQKLGHVDSEARVEGNRIYFSRGIERDHDKRDHKVYALDFSTGDVVWETDTGASSWRAPIILSDRVCWGFGEIFVKNKFGQLGCFDKLTGKPLTAVTLDGASIGTPLRLGNAIITADLQGGVCSIDPNTAIKNWCADIPKSKYSYASANFDGHGNILFPTEKDGLVVIDYKSGEKLFTWKPDANQLPWGMVMSAVHVQNDEFYVIDWKGSVRKLKPEYQ